MPYLTSHPLHCSSVSQARQTTPSKLMLACVSPSLMQVSATSCKSPRQNRKPSTIFSCTYTFAHAFFIGVGLPSAACSPLLGRIHSLAASLCRPCSHVFNHFPDCFKLSLRHRRHSLLSLTRVGISHGRRRQQVAHKRSGFRNLHIAFPKTLTHVSSNNIPSVLLSVCMSGHSSPRFSCLVASLFQDCLQCCLCL